MYGDRSAVACWIRRWRCVMHGLFRIAIVYAHVHGETSRVEYRPGHRWYYVSEMQPDEALLLKCFDSKTDGRARFMPWVLHQVCQTQQLNADDQVRCDYWMYGKDNGPMSFAGETVYSVRWEDGSTANGRFDPEQLRSRARPRLVTFVVLCHGARRPGDLHDRDDRSLEGCGDAERPAPRTLLA